MNANQLLAAGTGTGPGNHPHIPVLILGLVVLCALGYGAVRLTHRVRLSRPPRHSTKPGPAKPAPPRIEPPKIEPQRAAPAVKHPDRPNGGWAVETHGLTKRFGPTVAVDGVELLVPRGSAFGYLGPNGAGKTTLIRTLLGLTRADAGTMSLLGLPVPAERATARGGEAGQRIAPSLARVGLAERAGDQVAAYSMGMRQRLGVAACLLADPELLILDEPMNGLDPAGMHEMRAMIASLVGEGRTVVLSSHLLDEVERTCDAVAIVDHGRVIRQGSIDELIRGAGAMVVQVDCAEPAKAKELIDQAGIAAGTALTGAGLAVTLPAGASREAVADLNRRLVVAGIDVYGLQEIQKSLEDWFLSVTSRLGEPS